MSEQDPVAAAIAATDQPAAIQMIETTVTIASTGRPFKIAMPADLTDAELVEVTGWMLTAVASHLRAQRAQTAAGRIIIPGPGGRLT